MRYGHFDEDRDEYVIDRVDVPASWVNYLGTRDLCTVINQHAGGYSFYKSSQQGRVSRFRPNAVPKDRPGHYVYLRDGAEGEYWSATWQPVGKNLDEVSYRTRHGLSYSIFESEYRGIKAAQRVFVPLSDDVEIWDVSLTNESDVARSIDVFGYVEFSFHSIQIDNENFQMSLYASGSDYKDEVIEYDFYYEPWTYHFFTADRTPVGFDSLRDAFIGPYRSESNPVAVERGACSGSAGTTGNHCGALQLRLELAPGESARVAFFLGYGSAEVGAQVRAHYGSAAARDAAFAALGAYWRDKLGRLQVETPDAALNTLLNTWTPYQMDTCVVWSRFASFVEVGGRVGLGYRDTAQDIMGAALINPDKVRQRIWELMRGQMSAGYGLHLFDPLLFSERRRADIPVGVKLPTVVPSRATDLVHGLADACSDDHLWVVAAVAEYVRETGDVELLGEVIPFADTELDEASVVALGAGVEGSDREPASVYEHLRRAVDFTAHHAGAHGIAEGLRADWNDCLNLGGGESVLVTYLHVWAARELAGLAELLGEADDAARYAELADRVSANAEEQCWDGQWYLRGYTRDGVKVGSTESAAGQIFLEHMAWPVISQSASLERGRMALDAVEAHLASPYGTHLVWPSYTEIDDTIGYITRVYPGVKENGSIFSHPNAWPIIAETMLGRGQQAWDLYASLAPANFNDEIEVRGAEPYVYCQFLYGRDHDLYGRAENPWLTGTAGWMYQAVTKYLLGVRPEFDWLEIDPCLPPDWTGFEMTRQWRGAWYSISVRNAGSGVGVRSVVVDGVELNLAFDTYRQRNVARVPVGTGGGVPGGRVLRPAVAVGDHAQQVHRVEVVIG